MILADFSTDAESFCMDWAEVGYVGSDWAYLVGYSYVSQRKRKSLCVQCWSAFSVLYYHLPCHGQLHRLLMGLSFEG